MVLNAYDASAVEEALVINEGTDDPVDLVLIGSASATETIRKALAMGASEATHLVAEGEGLDSHAVAALLAAHFEGHAYDVILTGKQSQDTDAGLAGSMLAERLGLPYATNAVGLRAEGDTLVVTRQGDAGQEILALKTPCLVTCSNDMNNPRIPALKGIMAAKRKQIDTRSITPPGPRTRVTTTLEPPGREPGVKLEGEAADMVAELVRRLDAEANVL
ncbi:MAG: electron transfer flavoprotein subunit beta/FixA family protein [Bacteroidetes bacterium]|nr:electron transfer flavoprotein subunit beta/FixA family protein [Bacteroidota bacterium]MDA0874552.1 electron transfer flavoprotein subunit beta/FixA family protein [Bacteroidota bacterium]